MENIFICNGLEAILTKQRELNKLTDSESMPIFNIGEVITHVKNCPMCRHNFIEYINIELKNLDSKDPVIVMFKSLISGIIKRVGSGEL